MKITEGQLEIQTRKQNGSNKQISFVQKVQVFSQNINSLQSRVSQTHLQNRPLGRFLYQFSPQGRHHPLWETLLFFRWKSFLAFDSQLDILLYQNYCKIYFLFFLSLCCRYTFYFFSIYSETNDFQMLTIMYRKLSIELQYYKMNKS